MNPKQYSKPGVFIGMQERAFEMGYRIGVDIGGSFTDFAVLDEASSEVFTLKVLSRPDAPGSEITKGLETFAERDGIRAEDVCYFTHGTTVGINAVIQRKGVRLGLLTTRHFEDVLELGRLKIHPIHNLYGRRPDPLISRDRVFPIDERIDSEGQVLLPAQLESMEQALAAAQAKGCEGLVISFLNAYRNGANEQAVKAWVQQQAPGMAVFCASEIWPIIREYERTTTAVINGYVQPKVSHYLTSFEQALAAQGVTVPPRITKSNGGVMSAAQAKAESVQMILSGTASGVIGAGFVARSCGYGRILSLDIGGTSADVAVIHDGQAQYGVGEVVGEFQIHIPSVSVTSVGQGGGSIAWVDAHGVLKVGPDSAGSLPGPACYNRGGTRATVTDAFVVCGVIGHSQLGYSAVQVDRARSLAVVGELAALLKQDVHETAENIIRIATSEMYADVSALLSRFGIDPREYHFLAFGGAGPMMASYLARELNLQGVVVPLVPGVLSALGGLVADVRNDFIDTLYQDVSPAIAAPLQAALDGLRTRAEQWLRVEQAFTGESILQCSADMRYRGQSYEIETPLEPAWIERGDVAQIAQAFHREHARLFGHHDAQAVPQLISLRLVISGATAKPVIKPIGKALQPLLPRQQIEAFMDGQWRTVPVYVREDLREGHAFTGPAIVMQNDTTTTVLPDMAVSVDSFGNLVIACVPAAAFGE